MNNRKKIKIESFIIASIVLLIFFLSLISPTDPDLGFHIRVGERFWQTKELPTSNWFNYAFPESKWIAHELVAETLIYLLFQLGGFHALVWIFTGLMLVFSYLIFVKFKEPRTSWLVHIPLAFLTLISASFHAGVRLQVLSWLGIAILYVGYFAWRRGKPWPFWLWTIIFIVWANLHNSLIFVFGLILAFGILNLIFCRKSNYLYWLKILPIVAITSFLQPVTYLAHIEFFRTFTDSYKINIAEWQPATINQNTGIVLILSFTLFLISLLFVKWEDIKKIDFTLFVIALLFMFFGYLNIRNIPLALIALLPVFSQTLSLSLGQLRFPELKERIFYFLFSFLAVLLLAVCGLKIYDTAKMVANPQYLARKGGYPYWAVVYLQKHGLPKGRMFNDYGWGGYLVFNFPKTDWFFDGRLPHLPVTDPKDRDKKMTALEVYQKIERTEIDPENNRYHFSWVFIRRNSFFDRYLRKTGWRVYYQDGWSSILINKNSKL